MHLPFLIADFAFTQLYLGPALDLKIVRQPSFKFFALLWAIDFCWNDHLGSHREIKFSNSFMFTGMVWVDFSRFSENCSKKSGGVVYRMLLKY